LIENRNFGQKWKIKFGTNAYIVVKDFVQVGFVPDLDVVDVDVPGPAAVGDGHSVTSAAPPNVADTRPANAAVRLAENATQNAAAGLNDDSDGSPATQDLAELDPDTSTTGQTRPRGLLQILAKIRPGRSFDLEAFVACAPPAFDLAVDLGAN